MLAYARGCVDLTLGRGAAAGGAGALAANGAPLALSVRDAPTINSLIARAAPRPSHARVDALLERLAPATALPPGPLALASALAPAPSSPHSVIVHSRVAHTPSPPSSNEDSADSCGAPPGAKRKRKPDRTVRVPAVHPVAQPAPATPPSRPPPAPPRATAPSPVPERPRQNGETSPDERNGPAAAAPHARRKSRSDSAETIDDIAAMIASAAEPDAVELADRAAPASGNPPARESPVTDDRLAGATRAADPVRGPSPGETERAAPETTPAPAVVASRRRSARALGVATPSEAKPAETPAAAVVAESEPAREPDTASFVEVENQLEKMFAGIEERAGRADDGAAAAPVAKRRRSAAPKTLAEKKASRRGGRAASAGDERPKRRPGGRKAASAAKRERGSRRDAGAGVAAAAAVAREAYDSGSNASSSRSRGPYVQVRGPRDSPASVSVVNAPAPPPQLDEDETGRARGPRPRPPDYRNGLRARGLHCSTLSARYDATTADASWVCAFCGRGPHAGARDRGSTRARPLGDLFGPYSITTDCEEYRELDATTATAAVTATGAVEVWMHEECAVWAPGVVVAGARAWGLAAGVWRARGSRCAMCGEGGAGVSCGTRGCAARSHVCCARVGGWELREDEFRARCPTHADRAAAPPSPTSTPA